MSGISDQTLSRLPYYLRIIDEAKQAGKEYISAPAIAAELKLHEIQVRKDLAAVFSENGIPKKGFSVNKLLADIKDVMGTDKIKKALLRRCRSLGRFAFYEGSVSMDANYRWVLTILKKEDRENCFGDKPISLSMNFLA